MHEQIALRLYAPRRHEHWLTNSNKCSQSPAGKIWNMTEGQRDEDSVQKSSAGIIYVLNAPITSQKATLEWDRRNYATHVICPKSLIDWNSHEAKY